MTDATEPRDANERSTFHTGYGARVLWTLFVGYFLSPYAVWGCLAHFGFVSWTIDPMTKVFYAPLRFLRDYFDFIDSFYRWQCDLFWP
ncbi:MAG: hypothetical protein IAG10_08235 [Planctomycetaceae bacterium]|nr:hypothetical protein [Planctomycetaceae bacterium]